MYEAYIDTENTETFLGVDIWEEKRHNRIDYWAEVQCREFNTLIELTDSSLENLKDRIREYAAYNYYHELRHVCLTFGLDLSVLNEEYGLANAIKEKLEKKIIDSIKDTLS